MNDFRCLLLRFRSIAPVCRQFITAAEVIQGNDTNPTLYMLTCVVYRLIIKQETTQTGGIKMQNEYEIKKEICDI